MRRLREAAARGDEDEREAVQELPVLPGGIPAGGREEEAVTKRRKGVWPDGRMRVLCEGPDADGVTCGRVMSFAPESINRRAFRCSACQAERTERRKRQALLAPSRMLSAVAGAV